MNTDILQQALLKLATKEASTERMMWHYEQCPSQIAEIGPMTYEIAEEMKSCPKKTYRELRKLLKQGLVSQDGGHGHSRWWPFANGKPVIPTQL